MMKRKLLAVTSIVCFVGFTAIILSSVAAYGSNPHEFSHIGCKFCHDQINRDISQGEADLRADIDAQCVKCHGQCNYGKKHNGVAGTLPVAFLPLNNDGKIACFTCHDPHMEFIDKKSKIRTTYLRIGNLKRELCLSCHRLGGKKTGSLRIISPPAKSIFLSEYLPLIGKAEQLAGDYVQVTLNDSSFSLRIQGEYFYTRLRISEGLNIVELSSDGNVLWKGEIYGNPSATMPLRYDRIYSSHQTNSREECLGCHQADNRMDLSVLNPASEVCDRCHSPMGTKKFLHGPIGVGDCLSCHDPHGGSGTYHLKAEDPELCLSCHSPLEFGQRSHSAKGSALGSCLECHDPHQSDTWYLGRTSKMTIQTGISYDNIKYPHAATR